MAARASARARVSEQPRSRRCITAGCRSCGGTIRLSAASTLPPGNTNLLGMNVWLAARLPISTRGSRPSRRTMSRVAASLGRTARALPRSSLLEM